MKKGWKLFWLTCGITLVVGIALFGLWTGNGRNDGNSERTCGSNKRDL